VKGREATTIMYIHKNSTFETREANLIEANEELVHGINATSLTCEHDFMIKRKYFWYILTTWQEYF
jgi:hypothetical protein